jgi:hypothetical protein
MQLFGRFVINSNCASQYRKKGFDEDLREKKAAINTGTKIKF